MISVTLDRRMSEEDAVHLYNEVLHGRKNNDNFKFAGKFMVLKKNHIKWGNQDLERQT